MSNKPRILFYDLGNYDVHIHENGSVDIISKHTKNYGNKLAQWINPDGYILTKLNSKGISVHAVVCQCVYGERPKGLVINHKDGNKLNNHPDNLEYCTIAENIKHAIENNLHVVSNGTGMPTYIDGRAVKERKSLYKKEWYEVNKSRLKAEHKMGWALR